MIAEALTLARNFGPWFGGVALAAALAAGSGAWVLRGKIDEGRVARAEQQLDAFRADLADGVAAAERHAGEVQRIAAQERRASEDRIAAAVAKIPDQVAAQLAPRFTALRRTLDAPDFACLRMPLPADALELLRRPGGVAPAGRRSGEASPGP